jgi:hypothetical protein
VKLGRDPLQQPKMPWYAREEVKKAYDQLKIDDRRNVVVRLIETAVVRSCLSNHVLVPTNVVS